MEDSGPILQPVCILLTLPTILLSAGGKFFNLQYLLTTLFPEMVRFIPKVN